MNTEAAKILASLRNNVESTTHEADGKVWGQVYLDNVGRGHSFAGHLSALKTLGVYRPTGDQAFGDVLIVPVPSNEITEINGVPTLNGKPLHAPLARLWKKAHA